MCIAIVKPVGVKMPSKEILRNCWENNSDGGGIMYTDRGNIVIKKGFMTWTSFEEALVELEDIINTTEELVGIHCRITTDGGTCPENTHPFPISKTMRDLKETTVLVKKGNKAVMHNGVISAYSSYNYYNSVGVGKDNSDTQKFITEFLYHVDKAMNNWHESSHMVKAVEEVLDSRLAVFTTDKEFTLMGMGWIEEKNGIWYSNTSYKEVKRYGASKKYDYNDVKNAYAYAYTDYDEVFNVDDFYSYKEYNDSEWKDYPELDYNVKGLRHYLNYIMDEDFRLYSTHTNKELILGIEAKKSYIPAIDSKGKLYSFDLDSGLFNFLADELEIRDKNGNKYMYNESESVYEYVDLVDIVENK
ncbi:MAG: hypothetical protein ACRC5M_03590 [Anaeroplasmataceae bacterium]